MLLPLLASVALATENTWIEVHDSPGVDVDVHVVEEAPSLPRLTASLEGYALAMPGDGTGGGAFRLRTHRNVFLNTEVRGQITGDWTGRAVAGFDVLGRAQRWDLTLGMALGGAGDWRERAVYGSLGAGFQWGAAWHRERLHLSYQSIRPLGDSAPCLGLDERELRVGYDVTDSLRVFGTALQLRPDLEEDARQGALGIGARLTF
ncbi:MAG: hypothetical protein H6741_19355 [Alphaproteobacteria bacterium]|nr:hypothetical protein [Alphaproteobacteria bacterium]